MTSSYTHLSISRKDWEEAITHAMAVSPTSPDLEAAINAAKDRVPHQPFLRDGSQVGESAVAMLKARIAQRATITSEQRDILTDMMVKWFSESADRDMAGTVWHMLTTPTPNFNELLRDFVARFVQERKPQWSVHRGEELWLMKDGLGVPGERGEYADGYLADYVVGDTQTQRAVAVFQSYEQWEGLGGWSRSEVEDILFFGASVRFPTLVLVDGDRWPVDMIPAARGESRVARAADVLSTLQEMLQGPSAG